MTPGGGGGLETALEQAGKAERASRLSANTYDKQLDCGRGRVGSFNQKIIPFKG